MEKIEKIIEYTKKEGGCTFNNKMEILNNLKGYTISIQKFEFKTTLKNIDTIIKNIKEKIDIIGNRKNLYIGTWLDNGILYIDINKIEKNYTRAIEFAKTQKQLAIFDNVNKKSIYLKKDIIYILYEYIQEIKDIKYIKEFTSKKELCKNTGFYEYSNIKKYVYNEFNIINNYFIKNNKKYIVIKEEM